jgi:DeoR family transcriptional regulator of aga operon
MMESSERTILIADSTKLGKTAFARVADLGAVHTLITDEAAPKRVLDEIRERGVSVIVA